MTTEIARRPAADVSQEDWQDRVERVHQLDQQIKTGLLAGRVAWWATASAIYAFHQESGITVLMGSDTSLEEYCAQPEIALTRQSFMERFNAWRQVELSGLTLDDVQDVPYSLLVRMFKAINDGKLTFRKALDEARSLSRSDITEKYMPKAKKPDPLDIQRAGDDPPDPTEGLTAAGPDEGTGDEVGGGNLATTEESTSGQDAPDEVDPDPYSEHEHDGFKGEDDRDDDERASAAPKPLKVPEVAEAEESPETAAPQAVEVDTPTTREWVRRKSIMDQARTVVEAYRADSNPVKHLPKPIRLAIDGLAEYFPE